MRAIAPHEYHSLGTVGHLKTKNLLGESTTRFSIAGGEDNMSELVGQILALDAWDGGASRQEAENLSFRQLDLESMSAARILARYFAIRSFTDRDSSFQLPKLSSIARERQRPHRSFRMLEECYQIRTNARATHVDCLLVPLGLDGSPCVCEKRGCRLYLRQVKINAT